jgi:hypothetical protein
MVGQVSSEVGSLRRVEARFALTGDSLQLTLRAADGVLERLAAGRDDLEAALVGAGLQLVALRFEPLPATPAVPAEGG